MYQYIQKVYIFTSVHCMATVDNIRYHIVRTCKTIWYIYIYNICFVDPSIFTFGLVLWLEVVSVVFESTKRHDDPTASSSMDFVWAASRPGRLNQHSDNIRVAKRWQHTANCQRIWRRKSLCKWIPPWSITVDLYFVWCISDWKSWNISSHLCFIYTLYWQGVELVILYRPLRTPITGW